MSRVLAITLIASLGSGSVAFAGESLVQSAARLAQEAGRAQGVANTATVTEGSSVVALRTATWVNQVDAGSTGAFLGQGQPVLAKSGLKKRTKAMIYLALGVGFAATAYTIDHHVVNVTPSSLGTRQD